MYTLENNLLKNTLVSAAMMLAGNNVKPLEKDNESFNMKVNGEEQCHKNVMIVKGDMKGRGYFSILAYQGEGIAHNGQPCIWLSVNADDEGTYAIQHSLASEGAWALYNDKDGKGIDFFSDSVEMNKGFVSTCGAITISKIDRENRIISGHFRFNANNANGMVKSVSEGKFDNLAYYEQN